LENEEGLSLQEFKEALLKEAIKGNAE